MATANRKAGATTAPAVNPASLPLLSRDAILAAEDLPREMIAVPEWGGSVYVRGMNGRERDEYERAIMEAARDGKAAPDDARAMYAASCIVDANGVPMFAREDIPALSRKSAAALDRVFAKVQELSALTKADLDELVKNSEPGRSDVSPTA